MKRNLIWLAVCALALGLIAAGCGGGDDDDSGDETTATAAAITKAEFVQKADAICEQANTEVDQAAQQEFGNQQPDPAQLDQFTTDTLVPSIQGQLDDIRALGAPEGDEDQVNAILDSAQQALDKGKEDPSQLTSDTADLFADANQKAKAYGLEVCGQT